MPKRKTEETTEPQPKPGRPAPPPPGAAYASILGIAGLLGISRRRLDELRVEDPTFPMGRLFGGGGTLRFPVADVLAWADAQQPAKFSTIGTFSRRRG